VLNVARLALAATAIVAMTYQFASSAETTFHSALLWLGNRRARS